MSSADEAELDRILREAGPESLLALRRDRQRLTHEARMTRLRHQHRIESQRLAIAFVLVATLFGILVIGLFRDLPGEDINQFATG